MEVEGTGIERSQVVSALRCVRMGRRVERADWIEARRVSCSWMEGVISSSMLSEDEREPLACCESDIFMLCYGMEG